MLIRRAVLTLFAAALVAPSTAAAIPTDGNGPQPNATPVAAFTMSANPALTYQQVTFNASGSYDTDGSIVKYEWDLTGDGTFERTSTQPRTTYAYGTIAVYNVRLRVTDNRGKKSIVAKPLRVHRKPRAAFVVVPTVPTAGQDAILVAKESYDDNGVLYLDWDLDGNGSYETPAPRQRQELHIRTVFTTPGTHTVGLRVIDRYGITDTTTRTFTVKRAPIVSGDQVLNGGVTSAQ